MRTEAAGPATLAAARAAGDALATPVLVSLSAFGATEVRRHGQAFFAELCHAAGADGIEVRSELLLNAARELPAIAQALRVAGTRAVYSSADDLWSADGALNTAALDQALAGAQALGATRLKMSIGGFGAASHRTLDQLQDRLHAGKTELLIENNQTRAAGTLASLLNFFEVANDQGYFLGMTFDIGNWHWTGECPLQAALALAPQVRYVHCKGVQRQSQRWVAVALAESCAPWRAVLRALPAKVPWAIEYPLAGGDLLGVTRTHIAQLRTVAASMAARPPAFA